MRRIATLLSFLVLCSCATEAPVSEATGQTPGSFQPECDGEVRGRVLVEYDIDPDGKVTDPRIIAYEPGRVFNEAALEAVRKWRYEPTGERR